MGMSLGCLFSLVSIVGEALDVFGTEDQKKKYLAPLLKGEIFCAEALTEQGGSDFVGHHHRCSRLLHPSGQKRFVLALTPT
jgi:alkylation response protein AidB-like acyl-CoA dehydrogenase